MLELLIGLAALCIILGTDIGRALLGIGIVGFIGFWSLVLMYGCATGAI